MNACAYPQGKGKDQQDRSQAAQRNLRCCKRSERHPRKTSRPGARPAANFAHSGEDCDCHAMQLKLRESGFIPYTASIRFRICVNQDTS